MDHNDFDTEISSQEDACDCPHCLFMADRPKPRNRNERRALMKEMAKAMKTSYYLHSIRASFGLDQEKIEQ
jgi:hypothetical protein